MQIFDNQHVLVIFELSFKSYWGLCAVFPRGLYRVVFKSASNVLKRLNMLIINMLNDVCVILNVMEYEYLCGAKVSYYGRFEDRHSAYGYANPIRDAAGCRGFIGEGCIV